MLILVTGGTGFIGRFLVDALVDRGDQVTVVTRNPSLARQRGRDDVTYRGWLPSLEGYDAVVNLTGAPLFGKRWNKNVCRKIEESRVRSASWVAQSIAECSRPPKVFVSGSAIGFYGDRGSEVLSEEAPPGTGFLAEVCEKWETAALSPARTVLLRTGIVLHPSGGPLQQMLPPFRLGLGGPIGAGRQHFAWIHIADEIGLILWAIDNDSVTGPVNAVAPNCVTNREFSKALGKVLRRPAFLPVPPLALRLALGPVAKILTESQNCTPEVAERGGYAFQFTEVEEALGDLFKP